MYKIGQLKISADTDMTDKLGVIKAAIDKKCRVDSYQVEIIKESIDARDKANVCWVYTVAFESDRKPAGKNITEIDEIRKPYELPFFQGSMEHRPVVIGFGPCGIFAALILAQAGLRPVVLERGQSVEQRVKDIEGLWKDGILNPSSNVQFGEGGAGTFSDGKLTTGIKDHRIGKVLEEFVEAGASPEILYQAKPHIGTDILRIVVKNLREKIISLGGEIRFGATVTDFLIEDGTLKGVTINGTEILETQCAVLAPGHSARDTFRMLKERHFNMEQKPFSIGVRVEHPQSMVNESQYGEFAKYLPPADYKLIHHCENGRGVYTFCMCPGGHVIAAASAPEMTVTNGMSYSRRDGESANSALLVDVKIHDFGSDDVLAGMYLQEKYEHAAYLVNHSYEPVETTWKSFRDNEEDQVASVLPSFVKESYLEAMPHLGRKLRGFDRDDMVMKGIETRSSSPVRILRTPDGQSDILGVYPAGEGAGYAGGITSAAVDGIRTAEKILANMK